jgi:hypothetical protein
MEIIDRKALREKLEAFEERVNGLTMINGAFVKIRNLRIRKGVNKIIADVLFYYGEDGKMERYNNIEYPLKDYL